MARELVEQDDQGKAAARALCPHLLEPAAGGAPVKRAEARAYFGVVLAAVAEPHPPLLRVQRAVGSAGAQPEVEDLLYFVKIIHHQDAKAAKKIKFKFNRRDAEAQRNI
jgi:hypothetical protein